MDFQQGGGFQRPTVKGNWQCNDCGTQITELPFEPSGDRPIYCRDCFRKNKPPRRGGGGGGFQKRMFQGDWECSDCGVEIKELPFQPAEDQVIQCRTCYLKNRASR